jgi:hypothetical protein
LNVWLIQLRLFLSRWAWVLVVILAGVLILSRIPSFQHRITMADYSALRVSSLREHITPSQAFEALGRTECEETFRNVGPELTRVGYRCGNSDGSEARLMFDNGRLVATGQDGLN